jgi:CelD/BcsL family acetyltransferase involved in cellulose biosynthesis
MQTHASVQANDAATGGGAEDLETLTGELRPLPRHADDAIWRGWAALAKSSPLLLPELFVLQKPLVDEGEPLVAVALRGGDVRGVLPLLRQGRTLTSLASDHAPAYDYVGDPDAIEGVCAALMADRRWDSLVLDHVPTTSPLVARLPAVAWRHLCMPTVKPGQRAPYFELPGHQGRLSSKLRQNLRRWRRKLGDVELERIDAFSREALDEGVRIEAMAWKGAAGTSIGACHHTYHFYRALARLAARRGELDLYFLRARGERIAFLFALEDGHTIHGLKMGYDPAFAAFGPGHLLFSEVALDAERRGLLELRFHGRDDEWKRRWTPLTHDDVSIVVYRPTPRGAAWFLGRELIKPRLSEQSVARVHAARREMVRRERHCQRDDLIGEHTSVQRLAGRVRNGLGIRSGVKRVVHPPPAPKRRLGKPSRYVEGDWVKVKDAETIRATLDGDDKLRGLAFVPAQWSSCDRTYRVHKQTRRLVDDDGKMRAVSRTVLLDGMTCDGHGEGLGCGRHCPLMFRDDWLEPAEGPSEVPGEPEATAWARVRPLAEIRATLDDDGKTDGVTFMDEMGRFAGKRLPVVRRLPRVFELDRWTPTRGPVYLLEGAFCKGAAMGDDGPCDRACALLWHGDWLELE